MTKAVAALVLLWLLGGLAIEVASYLPPDPEWTLTTTFALFGSSFLVGALGVFYIAPALRRPREWPEAWRLALRWAGFAWVIYTAIWFVILLTSPGVPTHCGTLGSPACGHEYVFNNHGSLTVTDRGGFLAGVRVLVRLFAGPPIAVMSLILVGYREMGRSGKARAV